MSKKTRDGILVVFVLSLLVGIVAVFFTGCADVKGFAYTGDGMMSASQARQAAAVASAEAAALNEIADQQDATAQGILGAVDQAASAIGAPEIVSALIGAAGTLFIPPPGSRRKREEELKTKSRK